MEDDELVECPYDKTHMINALRMPYHLLKCRKNFPMMDLEVCPFNASHEVRKAELKFHMLNCSDRVLLERAVTMETMLRALNDNDPPLKKGYTELPRYRDVGYVDENWDADTNPRVFMINTRGTDESQRDIDHSLRRPVSHGKAAELAASSTPRVTQSSVARPHSVFDYGFLCLGRGRAKPTFNLGSEASTSAQVPNIMLTVSAVRPGLQTTIGRGRGFLPTSTA